ncbi:LPXTG cell wall anchor domain-containing protein [Vagococcus fluvialis]|uniref:LPXTG cell wall anchor domain-containing protein n=1 Tax=Vagococcus fluvialis TaxID=2738 RepID=UPI003B59A942
MKKTALMVASLLLLVGTGNVFADTVEDKLNTQESSVVEPEQTIDTQITEETKTSESKPAESNPEDSEVTVETPQDVKNSVEREIMFLNAYLQKGYITQEEYNTYVNQLNAAKTEEEVKQITDKIYESNQDVIHYRWVFSERYINLKNNINLYQENGTITQKQAEKLLSELENAKTLEDIQKVNDALDAILNEEERAVTDNELFYAQLRLDVLYANKFLTQDQYDQLSKELKLVKTNLDLADFYKSVELSSPDSKTFMTAYVEKYYGIQANIAASINNGSITQEQGDKLYAQLNAARTNEELDAVSKELDKLIKGTTTETSKQTTSSTSDKKGNNGANTLPKTGETSNSKLITFGGILLVGLGAGYLFFRKKQI